MNENSKDSTILCAPHANNDKNVGTNIGVANDVLRTSANAQTNLNTTKVMTASAKALGDFAPVAPITDGKEKPRILLITSSFEENLNNPESSDRALVQEKMDNAHYPIGISLLHSYVESVGNEINSLFLNSYSYEICFEEVDKALKEFKPHIVGLQILTQNRVSSYHIIEKIHREYPHMQIVLGGIHATAMHEQLIKKFPYVIAVIGEGEYTFAELIKKVMTKEDISQVKGISYSKDGNAITTPARPLIDDLDAQPFPKHELYFNHKREFACILTSRGCPFRCSFCALESITRSLNRTRSIRNVVDEIEYIQKKFPQLRRVWIHDDTFFLNNKRAIEFCDEIARRKIKLEFVASGRIKPVSAELIKKLEEANFVKILFGLESGTDKILLAARKGITQKDVLETFRLLRKSKMEVTAFLIVGLPGETMETVLSTAKFVQQLQKLKYIYYDDIGILNIYPGTEVCRLAKEAGALSDDYWLSEKITPIYTVEHSLEELKHYKKVLLDHISLRRFFTPDGFKAQYHMIPYIPRYLWERKELILDKLGKKVVKRGTHL